MREELLIAAIAYLIGSIPFGVLLARAFKLPDPRTIGSRNIGATNMLRTGNKKVAALTLLLDAGKGALAVWLFGYHHPIPPQLCDGPPGIDCSGMLSYYLNAKLAALALTAAALGHMFSPWLKFSGGKGFATLLGGMLAFSWPIGLAGCAVWLIVVRLTRYVSLASIAAALIYPLATLILYGMLYAPLALSAIVIWKHRSNIARLRRGGEPKFSLRSKG